MTSASQELCQELYDLSDWQVGEYPDTWFTRTKVAEGPIFICPKYDLGYLVRKVRSVEIAGGVLGRDLYNVVLTGVKDRHFATLDSIASGSRRGFEFDDTEPENALARLYIEMFKQGILQREGSQS